VLIALLLVLPAVDCHQPTAASMAAAKTFTLDECKKHSDDKVRLMNASAATLPQQLCLLASN
jgi:hypothetical protein